MLSEALGHGHTQSRRRDEAVGAARDGITRARAVGHDAAVLAVLEEDPESIPDTREWTETDVEQIKQDAAEADAVVDAVVEEGGDE